MTRRLLPVWLPITHMINAINQSIVTNQRCQIRSLKGFHPYLSDLVLLLNVLLHSFTPLYYLLDTSTRHTPQFTMDHQRPRQAFLVWVNWLIKYWISDLVAALQLSVMVGTKEAGQFCQTDTRYIWNITQCQYQPSVARPICLVICLIHNNTE